MRDPIVTITARTGAEPQLRYLNDGTPLASVRAAVSDDRPDGNGGFVENHTTWYDVAWFGKAAEQVSELAIGSGDLIRVTGSLFLGEYTRKDGTLGASLKLKADGTPRVWPKRDRGGAPAAPARAATPPPADPPRSSIMGGHDDPPF